MLFRRGMRKRIRPKHPHIHKTNRLQERHQLLRLIRALYLLLVNPPIPSVRLFHEDSKVHFHLLALREIPVLPHVRHVPAILAHELAAQQVLQLIRGRDIEEQPAAGLDGIPCGLEERRRVHVLQEAIAAACPAG